VNTCQERSYAEEIELLAEKGEDVDWILEGVISHQKNGISNDEVELSTRKIFYGSN
jgi:hypothetical protein